MSTRLQSRSATTVSAPRPAAPERPPVDDRREGLLLVPTVLVLAAACLPLGRAFIGWAWARPVLAAVLASVGLSWTVRRFGGGPVAGLLASIVGWAVFVTVAFLSHTAIAGIVPTLETGAAVTQLWAKGVELIRLRPAPTFAEPGLLLLTITGVWAVAHAVDGLVFRLQAPVKALLLSIGLWVVPLVVTPGHPAVPWTIPLLMAGTLLLFASSVTELGRWGSWIGPRHERRPGRVLLPLAPSGVLIAGTAIFVASAVAASLPGYAEPPWYDVSGAGGTTVTTNPIVTIKPSLTASDRGPIMEVSTGRPVYLRTTSLDVYSHEGEWTNEGIRGSPVAEGSLLGDRQSSSAAGGEALDVYVEVVDLPGAVLVPAPYRPRSVQGTVAGGFQFDERLATLTTSRDETLRPGDVYRVTAQLPEPDPVTLRNAGGAGGPADVQLPDNVPAQVRELARRIVDDAGAETPFERALAIQEEFQSGPWIYSLEPPQGHSADAMLAFLESRTGYCEQYAGTMAVMLRTLGVPARVAVGFTPGEAQGDGTYVVSDANAHAWVEVLFPGQGWLAFEPTPREDGNVLMPSADDVTPQTTVAERSPAEPVEEAEPEPVEPDPQSPVDEPEASPQLDSTGGSEAQNSGGATNRLWLLAGLLTALVGLGAGAAAVRSRRHGASLRSPSDRVLAARDAVARVGRGLGLHAAAWETDHEYLLRLAQETTVASAAVTLADRVAAVRYAPDLAESAAAEAEAAAGTLRDGLLAGRPAPQRAVIVLRGLLASAAMGLTDRSRRLLRR